VTLSQFGSVVGAEPRWVQNAMASLGLPAQYTVTVARRLALARLVRESCGMPLVEAYPLAARALAGWPLRRHWERASPDGALRIVIDLERFLSTFTARLSVARARSPGRTRGRPRRTDLRGIALAREHGVDLGLLRASLRRTPEERLRRLDDDLAFVRSMRGAGR